MFWAIGLGNPGKKHAGNRHNVGFMVVDALAARVHTPCDKQQLGALVVKTEAGRKPALLVKPQSFMNCSGQPAASLRGYYKLRNEDLVVIHDELELPFGEVRVKVGGGHAGHNGLRDLKQKLGDKPAFVRVRVGVGRPRHGDVADYVLKDFSSDEAAQLPLIVELAADAVEAIAADGVEAGEALVTERAKELAVTVLSQGRR